MLPVPFRPVLESDGLLVSKIEASRDEGMFKRSEMRRNESEGMIPVTEDYIAIYIVDCPSLHLVDGTALSPPRHLPGGDNNLITFNPIQRCPQCTGAFSKARRVPAQSRPQNHRSEYNQRSPPPPLPSRSLSPPPAFSSQVSLLGPYVATTSQERPPHNSLQSEFSQYPSELRLVHEEPIDSEPELLDIVERPVPGPAIRPQYPRPMSTISTDNSSLHESTRTSRAATGIFRFPWGRSSKVPTNKPNKTRATASLPDSIQFCFSSCATRLLVWRRNGDSIIRICAQENYSKLLSLTSSIPTGEADRSVNIKFVAEGEGWISVILLNKQRFLLVMLHSSGSQQTLIRLPQGARPITLAMSRNNSFVAIGYGSFIQVHCFYQMEQVWTVELRIKEFQIAEDVRFQIASFSPDCKYLTVATQKFDRQKGKEDDGVWTRVWTVSEVSTGGTLYGFCFMPTDHLGVTSAYFDPQLNKVFVTGFIDTPYPLFHSTSNDSLQQWSQRKTEAFSPDLLPISASRPVSYTVRCASQSPHPSYACFLTATNKLYRVNAKTETAELLCDVSAQRSRLGPREEAAALGMPSEGVIYMVWKEGAKLHFIEFDSGGNQINRMDLRRLYETAIEG